MTDFVPVWVPRRESWLVQDRTVSYCVEWPARCIPGSPSWNDSSASWSLRQSKKVLQTSQNILYRQCCLCGEPLMYRIRSWQKFLICDFRVKLKALCAFEHTNGHHMKVFKEVFFGAPGWLSRLSVQLRLRSWSPGLWVRALRQALCWHVRAWILLQILCLPLPCSCSVSLSLNDKR